MRTYCTNCGDQYDPTEYAPAPVDPDEPRFCSDDCEDEAIEQEEFDLLYQLSRYSGAPVF
jgi:hypothetical protein